MSWGNTGGSVGSHRAPIPMLFSSGFKCTLRSVFSENVSDDFCS